MKPSTQDGGFLFAIVNPSHEIIQLGLRLSPSPDEADKTIITFYFNDYRQPQFIPHSLARFAVDEFTKEWTRFAVKVKGDDVTLYLNCDEFETVRVDRTPRELEFEEDSTLYLAQAGYMYEGNFEVSLLFLSTVSGNFNKAGTVRIISK